MARIITRSSAGLRPRGPGDEAEWGDPVECSTVGGGPTFHVSSLRSKGRAPRSRVDEEDDAQGECVAAFVDALAEDLLRRHVSRRSERSDILELHRRKTRRVCAAVRTLRDAKIEDLRLPASAKEDVLLV